VREGGWNGRGDPHRYGVPVAGVQKTTIRTFMVRDGEENEELHPQIPVDKNP
jgi:hypothetical protein